MKKVFRRIGLLSLAFVAAIAFSACSGKKTAKKTTDNKPSSATKVTTKSNTDQKETYSIRKVGNISGVEVKVYEVKVIDGIPSKEEITDLTKEYEKGTKLYFKVTNNSTSGVKIDLTLGGTDYKNIKVNANSEGEITDVILTGDLVYTISGIANVDYANVTVTCDHSHDTSEEINSVHVYDPNDPDRVEKTTGSEVEIGSELKVFVWNVATDVHLKITNGTTTVAEKDYPKLREDQIGPGNYGHDEYFTFTVSGDVKVEVTYIEEITTKYTVTVDNSFNDLTVNMSYVDENMNVIPVQSGTEVPLNTVLYVQLINDSTTTAYVAYAEINNNVVNGGMVDVGPDMFGGFSTGINATGNITIKTEELSAISVTFTKMTGVNVLIQDLSGFDPVILDSGDSTFKYCPISVEIENTLTVPVILTLTYMDQTMGMTIPAGEKLSEELIAESSASFVIEEYVEYDCEIDLGDYALTPYIMYMSYESSEPIYLENGSKVPKNAPVMIMIMNQEETKILILTIKNGDTVVYNGVLPPYYMLEDEYITITGKLVVTVAEAILPDDTVNVSLDNDIDDAAVKLEFIDEDGETVTVTNFSATIPIDTEVTITITNNSEIDILATIICDGTSNVMTILSGDNDDCTITASTDISIVIEENSEEIDEYTITVNNEYADANPYKGFRIYATYDDEGGDEVQVTTFPVTLPENTEVTIDASNFDEDYKYLVTLIVNGETYDSKVIKQGNDDYFVITLQANVTVNVEKIVNTDGFTITVNNDFDELYIDVTYVDEDGDECQITNYNIKYEAGLALTISADNYYDTYLFKVSAIIGGEEVDYVNVDNLGFSYIELDLIGDLTIVVEKTGEVEDDEWEFAISSLDDVEVVVLTSDDDPIDDGDLVDDGTIVSIEITNNSSKPCYINISMSDSPEVSRPLRAGETYHLNELEVMGDIEITINELNGVHINYSTIVDDVTIKAYDLSVGISDDGYIETGEVKDGGTQIGFVVINNSEKEVYVYVWNGSFTFDGELDYFCDVIPAGSTYTYDGTDIYAYWDFGLHVTDTHVKINYDLGGYDNVRFDLSYTLLSGSKYNINNGDDIPYSAPINGKITNNEDVDLVIEVYFDDPTYTDEPWSYFTVVAHGNIYLSEGLNCILNAGYDLTLRVVYLED